MADASYSHKFMGALADSLGWKPGDVQKALDEIAALKATPQMNLDSVSPLTVNTSASASATGFAAGDYAQAEDYSVAIGRQASAVRGSVAIGPNATATEANTFSVGDARGDYNRIVNVADPVGDHDAATKAYVTERTPTADAQTAGLVKVAHEVTNDSTEGVAVSPEAVYKYADPAGHCLPYNVLPPSQIATPTTSNNLHLEGWCVYGWGISGCIYGSPDKDLAAGDVVLDLTQSKLWDFFAAPSRWFNDTLFLTFAGKCVRVVDKHASGTYMQSAFFIPLNPLRSNK